MRDCTNNLKIKSHTIGDIEKHSNLFSIFSFSQHMKYSNKREKSGSRVIRTPDILRSYFYFTIKVKYTNCKAGIITAILCSREYTIFKNHTYIKFFSIMDVEN